MKCKQCGKSIENEKGLLCRCPDCGTFAAKSILRGIPLKAWLISGVWALIGLACIVFSICNIYQYHVDQEHYADVRGQIVEIQKETSPNGDVDRTVFVCYTYRGTTYERVALKHYNSAMREGDFVQIKIDVRNPERIIQDMWWVGLVGLFMLVIAAVAFYLLGLRPDICENSKIRIRFRFGI